MLVMAGDLEVRQRRDCHLLAARAGRFVAAWVITISTNNAF
jgi:hypothetical protein